MTVTAATQRRQRTHPLVVLLRSTLLLVLIAAVVATTAIAFAPAPRVAATPVAVPEPTGEPVSVDWPAGIAQQAGYAVAGIEGSSEAWGTAEPVPMASLAKVLTVLVVLERHPLSGAERGDAITLGRADLTALGEAIADAAPTVPVFDGMVVAQRDLVEWSLVDSAANAMWSLARWAFGSVDAYVAAANDWAARHGLDDTVVDDPSGLSLESRSTAADLTELALLAVAHPVVLETMGMERVAVPGGTAANTNPLLGDGFIDGGKTGTLFAWGRNLLVTAERTIEGEPRRVVAVILGVDDQGELNAGMLALVGSLWDDFGTATLLPAGALVAEYRAPWGATVRATTAADLEADAFGPLVPTLEAEVGDIETGAPRGRVGAVRVAAGAAAGAGAGPTEAAAPPGSAASEPAEVEVRTEGMLPGPDLLWRLTHPSTAIGWYLD